MIGVGVGPGGRHDRLHLSGTTLWKGRVGRKEPQGELLFLSKLVRSVCRKVGPEKEQASSRKTDRVDP